MGDGITIKEVYNKFNDYFTGAATGDKPIKKVKFPPIFQAQNFVANYNDGTIWSNYGSAGSYSTASTNLP